MIGLNGQAGSGKDTVYERIVELSKRHALSREVTRPVPVERVAFADKLKDSACALLGIDREYMEDLKNSNNVEIGEIYPEGSYHQRFDKNVRLNMRLFLQRYGTEAHRDIFGQDFWVDQTLDSVEDHMKLVLVTDCRFPNEVEGIRARSGFIWNVQGPDFDPNPTHSSEQVLSDDMIDVVIMNKRREDKFHALDSTLSHLLTDILDSFSFARANGVSIEWSGNDYPNW